MLICPVCGETLTFTGNTARCRRGHCYDIAKEGYVNLLRTSIPGALMGDDKQSARCRQNFLNKGYYGVLRDALREIFRERQGKVLDICCGEGYYSAALGENPNLTVYGFDLSKEMVRLAAKRGGVTCFVANMAAIPVAEASFDYAIHLFAPFNEDSFARVLKPGGRLLTVVPGKMHLFGLKQTLYAVPYENDEKLPQTKVLKLVSVRKVTDRVCLASQEDIQAVFRMTPYYFHTSQPDKDKLLSLRTLQTPVEFCIAELEKPLS